METWNWSSFENRARVRRPPGDWVRSPRENAAAIGSEQARDGQITTHGHQPPRVRLARVGKRRLCSKQNRLCAQWHLFQKPGFLARLPLSTCRVPGAAIHGRQQRHLELPGDFHGPEVGGCFFIQRGHHLRGTLGRSQRQPGAHADVVEHLQQPFRLQAAGWKNGSPPFPR